MRFLTTALAIAALSLAPAALATDKDLPNLVNPTKIVNNITIDTLSELLTEMGAKVTITDINDGKGGKLLMFADGGVPYNMLPTFCEVEPGKCLGFTIFVIVDNGKGGYPVETLNTANKNTSLLTFYKEDSQRFVVGRVEVVDGGVAKKNIGMEIAIFAVEFREALKRLESQLVASVGGPLHRASFGAPQLRPVAAVPPQFVVRFKAEMEQRNKALHEALRRR